MRARELLVAEEDGAGVRTCDQGKREFDCFVGVRTLAFKIDLLVGKDEAPR